MAKSKANRHSLTMPVPESARQALRDAEAIPSSAKSGSSAHYPPSRDREPASTGYAQTKFTTDTDVNHAPRTPTSPNSPGLPSQPFSTDAALATPPRHGSRDTSKPFFSSTKSTQSGTKTPEASVRRVPPEHSLAPEERKPSRTKSTPDLRAAANNEPVPDLPPIDPSSQYSQNSRDPHRIPRRPINQPNAIMVPNSATYHTFGPGSPAVDPHDTKKNRRHFFGMKRNTSGRSDDNGSYSKPSTPVLAKAPDQYLGNPQSRDHSAHRNPSPLIETDDLLAPPQGVLKDQRSQSFRDGPGSVLFQGLSKSAGKAVSGFSKTKKWLGGGNNHNNKNASSGAARLEPIPNYQVMNLTLPLQEQTRVTRIARRLEDSKDKTEFWMPALPWRCIDYLNFNGCESEGLYRIPGSDREIKLWWQRFDQDLDIDLFNQEGLYDVNVIGSLFKMWLRNLPEPILDEAVQEDLINRYEDQKQAPDELKEILSKLPPWNYYLLFAITCHLSLLNAYEEKNKMSLQNLFICVGPGLKMKQKCFTWLVGDWRSCWTGCTTEKEALEEEYRLLSSDPLQQGQQAEERKTSFSSAASGDAQVPHAPAGVNASQRNMAQDTQIRDQQQQPVRRKEHRPARLSPGRSKDDSHLHASGDHVPDQPLGSPVHGRSKSHIPELNLPGKMSPLFAPDGTE